MKKSTMFLDLVQSMLPEEELKSILAEYGYEDTARKCTAYYMLKFFAQAAFNEWSGYRDGEARLEQNGLEYVHFSALSKKAKDVPFEIYKRLFHELIQKCNRKTRRKLKYPKELLVIDSTQITVGRGRLPWAPIKGKRAGVKLNVALHPSTGQPRQVVESTGNRHDAQFIDALFEETCINVADRIYAKCKRFDKLVAQNKDFIIRLKDQVVLHKPRSTRRVRPAYSIIELDVTCQLGTGVNRSTLRHRVIQFHDRNGNLVKLATSLKRISAEMIAEMYKLRWQIEVFFRWIKQHLNIPVLFGTTPNAVFSQLYTGLMIYVLLKRTYDDVQLLVPSFCVLSFASFARLLLLQTLPVEWVLLLFRHKIPING
jgi:IS4 transposase